MHVRHLTVGDFRSYAHAEVALGPGVTIFIGQNGQGKTNLVEAIGYLATLGSHRVSNDQPLVRFGAEKAIIRAAVVAREREQVIEVEINPGRANRARLGRSALGRPRDILGVARTVLFAPEDLRLVKGDPADRRRFLDDLLVQRQPRWAGVRADYDKILKQRNALLKSAAPQLRGHLRGQRSASASQARSARAEVDAALGNTDDLASALHTLDVWTDQLADAGSHLLYARLRLLRDLAPDVAITYDEVSAGQSAATLTYQSSIDPEVAPEVTAAIARIATVPEAEVPAVGDLRVALHATLAAARRQEIERGLTLAGPHRDDLVLSLGPLPAKGYASHGESWSFALALKLAAYRLLHRDLDEHPILILDDVFAELDTGRRARLAELISDCEQVLITAAVEGDVPPALTASARYRVSLGEVVADG